MTEHASSLRQHDLIEQVNRIAGDAAPPHLRAGARQLRELVNAVFDQYGAAPGSAGQLAQARSENERIGAQALAALAALATPERQPEVHALAHIIDACAAVRVLLADQAGFEERVRQQVQAQTQALSGTVCALANLAQSRGHGGAEHLQRMQQYCRAIAGGLAGHARFGAVDATFIETLVAACPLHDIGNVAVPDRILRKPGQLDDAELAIMQHHTTHGGATLLALSQQHGENAFLKMGVEVTECHHEKWDGSGYPFGLRGKGIPLAARIVAIADVYDALRSERAYRPAFAHAAARAIIGAARGTHFDPDLVDCFVRLEDQFAAIWDSAAPP